MGARVLSLSVGLPRTVRWQGRLVSTGIFKSPVDERLHLDVLDFEGDGQADLTVHGGLDKAVYVYASEHYPLWQAELDTQDLPHGSFGENLTLAGLVEPNVHLGDVFRVGTSEVVVTQPRMPCYKLGIKFRRADMPRLFLASRRSGFYLRVVYAGEVAAGDAFELVQPDKRAVPVTEVTELYLADHPDADRLRRMMEVPALPESWRHFFAERLDGL